MGQICSNVMGHLTTKGLYPALHTLLREGLTKRQPALSPTILNATMIVAWRYIFLCCPNKYTMYV